VLVKRMEEALDGDYQTYKARDGAYVREHFFGASPELLELVADMSDDEVWRWTAAGTTPARSMRPTARRWRTRASRR